MLQIKLNQVNIDDWYDQEIYSEIFRLKLTSKHELVVGKWVYKGEWGIDLREWSYDQSRLLGTGITINSSIWEIVFKEIKSAQENDLFSTYIISDGEAFSDKIVVDRQFAILLSLYENAIGTRYLCINLVDDSGKRIFRGFRAPVGIMVRLDTVKDFVFLSYSHGLIKQDMTVKKENKLIDKKTGREIF